jgi:hypothetical protein
MTKLAGQLANRRYRVISGRSKTESKKDFESRGFSSPNDADSLSLLVLAARRGSQVQLSMRENNSHTISNIDDSWMDSMYKGGARIDATNQTEVLDSNFEPMPDGFSW